VALDGLRAASDALQNPGPNQRFRDSAHHLFWTARAVRAACKDSRAEVLKLAGRYERRVWNLDLQIAVMIGDAPFLEQELRGHRSKEWQYSVRSNLALALADAGQLEAAREMLQDSAIDGFDDNAKRMAWAWALCGDFDHAFKVAESLPETEEAMRALHRIQDVAQAKQAKTAVSRAAELAKQLLDRPPATNDSTQGEEKRSKAKRARPLKKMAAKRSPAATPGTADYWRVETWAAHILAVAGRDEEAMALAESICRRNIASIEANSLCYPTPYSARRRKHVVPQDAIDVDAFRRELASVTGRSELSGIRNTCERLEQQTGQSAWGDMSNALIAMGGPEASGVAGGWLDAVVAAARLGRAEVGAVARLSKFVDDAAPQQISEADVGKSLEEGDRILALSGR
jgi:tetratricopeptide (TPR) repeat protein